MGLISLHSAIQQNQSTTMHISGPFSLFSEPCDSDSMGKLEADLQKEEEQDPT